MPDIDPDIQKLLDESERLMDQAQQLSLDAVCRAQGVDPQGIRAAAQQLMTPEARQKAQEEIAQDRQDIASEVDMEATRRGLKKSAPAGVRRRFGNMV